MLIIKLIKSILLLVVILALTIGAYVVYFEWRHEVYVEPTYDKIPPQLPEFITDTQVLVFSKTNGFRHIEAIPVANALFQQFADKEGWSIYFTENAAIHNAQMLGEFDLLIWNNVSGDVLTLEQRQALREYLEQGGRFLGLHGTAGDSHYEWSWYPLELIRAQFIGHPLFPQFQKAVLTVESREHPATAHLNSLWSLKDEWYSFDQSPRERTNVLVSIQEDSYSPGRALEMGDDHPLVWHHSLGRGRVFYTALGHRAEIYQMPGYQQFLLGASDWLLRLSDTTR